MQITALIILSGLTIGSIYAMMALGYYLVSSATGVINFAQGEFAMLAAVASAVLVGLGVWYPLAILGGIAATLAVSIVSFYGLIVPLRTRGASLDAMIVALLGLTIVLRYGTGLSLGRAERALPAPFDGDPLIVFEVPVQQTQITIIFVTLGLFLLTSAFIRGTWIGRSYQVAALNPIGAQICGVNLALVQVIAFGAGAIVAGIAGWLYAPLYAATYLIGGDLGLKGFLCLVVGGLSRPYGALAGGITIGLLETLSQFYVGSPYSEGVPLLMLIIVLMGRPGGLLGGGHRTG
jgi:branched-chain amino acid transport system permease protein